MRIDQVLRSGLFAIVVTILAGSPAVAQAEDGGPTEEGIEVHGHWIIEVYEGDQLVERREFENALRDYGAERIARMLGSFETPGEWWIGVKLSDCAYFQVLAESSCNDAVGSVAAADSLSVPSSGDDARNLVLTKTFGSVTTVNTTSIEGVATSLGFCDNTTDPASCTTGTNTRFTEKALATPITVEPDQTVNITVIISFTG